jgi:RecA/RadA recombinase
MGKQRTLRAHKPTEVKPSKPKILIFGKPGVGKTWTALDFPAPYYIDTEGGANLGHYQEKLARAGGAYLGPEDGSNDFQTVIDEVTALSTTSHPYKTLIIDSFTKLYMTEAGIAEETVGSEFGRDKKEAQRPTRKLVRMLDRLDMTVILICHEKDKWERMTNAAGKQEIVTTGQTFDGWDKLEYELHLALQVMKQGTTRKAVVRKSRLQGFVEGVGFPWSYSDFAERFGRDIIESGVVAINLATDDQVRELTDLIALLRVDKDEWSKWLAKANVDSFEEMDADTVQKCIDFLNAKLNRKVDVKDAVSA